MLVRPDTAKPRSRSKCQRHRSKFTVVG